MFRNDQAVHHQVWNDRHKQTKNNLLRGRIYISNSILCLVVSKRRYNFSIILSTCDPKRNIPDQNNGLEVFRKLQQLICIKMNAVVKGRHRETTNEISKHWVQLPGDAKQVVLNQWPKASHEGTTRPHTNIRIGVQRLQCSLEYAITPD